MKWNATNKLSFNLGVVNFLNQKGASGTISGSELIGPEEAKRFNGYVMSGRYLRPFTVEFGASIKLKYLLNMNKLCNFMVLFMAMSGNVYAQKTEP